MAEVGGRLRHAQQATWQALSASTLLTADRLAAEICPATFDYIAGIYKAAPILGTGYLTVEGSTLVRVTGELKSTVNRVRTSPPSRPR
jgi:hypothetical protein